jgi:hypothetical protein
MSERWLEISPDLLNCPAVQLLPPDAFRRQFYAALAGEQNAFTPLIRIVTGRPPQSEWAEIRAFVFERDDYTCQYCGEYGGRLECDHVVPVSRGGTNDFENLLTACFGCNRSKRDKLLSEWLS